MFTQLRANTVKHTIWNAPPNSSDGHIATWFEFWNFTNGEGQNSTETRHGRLKDEGISDWVTKKNPPTSQRDSRQHLIGGIRVLACERTSQEVYRLSLPFSYRSYDCLERHLKLHPSTLPSFYNLNGTCSLYSTYEGQATSKLSGVNIFIKAPQKVQVRTWGLSLFHDFRSSITTAFILVQPAYRDMDWGHFVLEPPLDEFWKLINAAPQLCNHPLFLPTALLSIHVHKTTDYCVWHGSKRLYELEEQMGVTRTGVLAKVHAHNFISQKTVREAQKDSWSLLVDLNCRLTETIFNIRVSEWHQDCVSFLLESTEDLLKTTGQHPDEVSNGISEMLRYLRFSSKSLFDCNNEQKARIQSQLDALFLFQSQTDNFLSAHLAESAGYDGIAMKTLAIVTTLFLPATFVATLFSMSMFNWTPDDAQERSHVVSSHFWVYWAVTVPLMFLVVIAWAVWQRREIERYRREVWDRKIQL